MTIPIDTNLHAVTVIIRVALAWANLLVIGWIISMELPTNYRRFRYFAGWAAASLGLATIIEGY